MKARVLHGPHGSWHVSSPTVQTGSVSRCAAQARLMCARRPGERSTVRVGEVRGVSELAANAAFCCSIIMTAPSRSVFHAVCRPVQGNIGPDLY